MPGGSGSRGLSISANTFSLGDEDVYPHRTIAGTVEDTDVGKGVRRLGRTDHPPRAKSAPTEPVRQVVPCITGQDDEIGSRARDPMPRPAGLR